MVSRGNATLITQFCQSTYRHYCCHKLGKPIGQLFVLLVLVFLSAGCTSWKDYLHNGFKVGPNYCKPDAAVAEQWIDATDIQTAQNAEMSKQWWNVFGDTKLNELIVQASRQNLTLREAGYRIMQARATRDIAVGNIFPQSQNATGSYGRQATSLDSVGGAGGSQFSNSWNMGFNLNWELDFWGRFRRAVASANANLDASVEDYDGVLVTLLADVAENYVTVRTTQERIALLQKNAELQRKVLRYVENRLNAGKQTELDQDQATGTLHATESGIPELEIAQRQAENNLCILLGVPPVNMASILGTGPTPVTPPDVVINIPADLLRRRPDVRRAERIAAAQAEQIGIAQADLYPSFFIDGSLGYTAQNFPDLFHSNALNGSIGPSFRWNLLNYGRIANNVRYQEAKFQELVVQYQRTVLVANKEVEDGLVAFLRAQRRCRLLDKSVVANEKAVHISVLQYEKGKVDFNRYATVEQNLVTQQDSAAQARGQIAQGLISVFRALGGGWEIRLENMVASDVVALPRVENQPAAETPSVPVVPQQVLTPR